MSVLFDLAGQLAPHFSFFAGRMVDGVMDNAVQRIADRSVDAGEGAFRSLVGGTGPAADDEAGPTAPEAAELDALLARLTDTDRARLAAALATWLNGPPGRHELLDLLGAPQPAPAAPVSVVSRGDHNNVFGVVGTVNQHQKDDRP
ncbi:hypothetical protein [Streptomyces sp. NPDC091416]|uniref:hypothetical protein n=1 Tax=Streptomyces sp. NPDC091416 TaxID=3366003 RepID=UPI0037FC06A7